MAEGTPLVYCHGYRLNFDPDKNASAQELMTTFEDAGYQANIYRPDWESGGPEMWQMGMVDMGVKVSKPGQMLVFAGFSLGAFTATLATKEVATWHDDSQPRARDERIIACSPSPFDRMTIAMAARSKKSDIPTMPSWLTEQLRQLTFPRIPSPAILIAGRSEPSQIGFALRYLEPKWPNALIIKQPSLDHDILSPAYIDIIRRNIGWLATAPRTAFTPEVYTGPLTYPHQTQ